VLYHTALKFGGIVAVSFWSMAAVVLSGVIGRFIYVRIPRTIQGNELSVKELEPGRRRIDYQAEAGLLYQWRSNAQNRGMCIPKTFFSNNLSASLNYSETDYSFSNSSINLKQRSIILNAGFRFITKLFLNLSYESTFESKNTFNRILTDVSLHF